MRLACFALALGSLHALYAFCPPPGPLCSYARSEAVFLGRVVEAYPRSKQHAIEIWLPRLTGKNRPSHWNDDFIPTQTTRFEVVEAYRGVSGKNVVLHTKMEPHMGYTFEQGATYLVFADRDENTGILTTNGCGYTNSSTATTPTSPPSASSSPKPNEAASTATPPPIARNSSSNSNAPSSPSPTSASLTSPLSPSSTTAPDGSYDFSFIPAGLYTLTATLNGEVIYSPRQLTIEPQTCWHIAILVVPALPLDPRHPCLRNSPTSNSKPHSLLHRHLRPG
ncbi:MAG: hypothetical protein IPJ98_07275 [Bryobacterales bacterium]|nr:hypothetical protein [Bryobacterales bacterium]